MVGREVAAGRTSMQTEWEARLRSLDGYYRVLSTELKTQDRVQERLKHQDTAAPITDSFQNFLSVGLTSQKQRELFLLGLFVAFKSGGIDDAVKLIKEVQAAHELIRSGGKPTNLDQLATNAAEALKAFPPEARVAYDELAKALNDNDPAGTLMLKVVALNVLELQRGKGDIGKALGYLKENWLDADATKKAAYTTALRDMLGELLKARDVQVGKKMSERFDELMRVEDQRTGKGLMNERERLLFLQLLEKLENMETAYIPALVSSVYEAAKAPARIHTIYTQLLDGMTSAWGDRLRKDLQAVFEHQEQMGVKLTDMERILIMLGFHYSFVEAFATKVHEPQFVFELATRAVNTFVTTATETQRAVMQGLTLNQQLAVVGALTGQMGQTTPERNLTDQFLVLPVTVGGFAVAIETVNILATGLISYIRDKVAPGEFLEVERILADRNIRKGLINTPYSAMEVAGIIGVTGSMWRLGPRTNLFGSPSAGKQFEIDEPLAILARHKNTHFTDYFANPGREAMLMQLIAVSATNRIEEPAEGLLQNTIIAIDGGVFRTDEQLADFVAAMQVIGQTKRYSLAPVASAIMDATEGEKNWIRKNKSPIPLGDVLQIAQDLARSNKEITGENIRAVHNREKRIQDLDNQEALVPVKKPTRLAGVTPKKKGRAA